MTERDEDFAGRVERLFAEAMSLDPRSRSAFIAEAAGADTALRDSVLALLAAAIHEDPFWDTPALQHAAAEGVDADLGRYRLLEPIGSGGMGIVHKAVRADDEFSKVVAVKVVLAPDPDLIARFRRERQMLASLEHPHIARLLDGGTAPDGSPFLVMEYVDGVPIDRHVRERRLDTLSILLLMQRVCDAVSCAHRNLIVHRDLKPANILVTRDGQPKLLDFGVAGLLDPAGGRNLGTATAAMTLEYASPEQVRGGVITTAADVYGLGLLLYELLSGRKPFAGAGNTAALTQAILTEQPAPMGVVDSDLEHIVQMALRKEPERRYSSVEQLADDLRRYAESRPVLARPDSRAYRARKFAGRNKGALAAAAVLLVTLAGGVAATLWQARAAERRFRQVRNLANTYLLEIHDAIKDLPGSMAARQLVVRRAVEYLDQLAAERGNDAQLARELADGYAKIGDIQNLYAGASLGNLAAAVASHRKAIGLLEPLHARDPRNADIATALAHSYGALDTMMMQSGDLASAVSYGRRDTALLEGLVAAHPADAKLHELLAIGYIRLGDVTGNPVVQNFGDSRGALELYRKALRHADAAATAVPGDWEKEGLVAVVHARTSQALMALGDSAGEIAENRECLAIDERLLARRPDNVRLQWEVATAHRNLSLSLLRAGRTAESRGYAQESLRRFRALAASDANNVNAHEQVANALALIGRVAADSGDPATARQLLRRSIAAFEELRARHAGVSPDVSEQSAYSTLADVGLSSGDPAAAVQAARGELAIDDRLLRVNPKNANAERSRANATRQIARAHELLGVRGRSGQELRRALSLYRDSLAILKTLQADGALAPAFVRDLDTVSQSIARCDQEAEAIGR